MKLPVEVLLHILGFLDRQALGRLLVANRRLSGIINRHRKMLNLPEIPIPPRLTVFLKCLVILTAATLLAMPIGISYAKLSTRRRLRAAGLVPEDFHNVTQGNVSVPCTTTCDSPLQCHAECAFQYTLLDDHKGKITKRNCSSTGFSTTNASITSHIGWSCSFDYVVNETTVDVEVEELNPIEWYCITWISGLNATVALAYVVICIRVNRTIADAYMAATQLSRRDTIRTQHDNVHKHIIGATVITFIVALVYGSAVQYGMTFQSFLAVDKLFISLMVTSFYIALFVLSMSCTLLMIYSA